MATYAELLADTLSMCDQTGVTPASDIAKIALVRCMKYVAARVYIPALEPSASYVWVDGDTEAALVADFGITLTDFISPELLLVNGVPHAYRDYKEWIQLKASPARGYRDSISEAPTLDERPTKSYTLDTSNNIIISPVPNAGDTVQLFYRTPVAAYGDGSGSPEIHTDWDHILVDGAVAWIQAWERNQDEIITPGQIFSALNPQIEEMNNSLNSSRQRRKLRLSASYRIPR